MNDIDYILKTARRIHFIGIGGAGMCPLAEILHAKGYNLTGSDNNESDTLARIRSLGIPVTLGHKRENVEGADMIVHTAALLPDNPELVAARELGIPVFERSKLFGAVSRHYPNCVGICGTHGKTTTTSMTVQILLMAGLDPSAVIGGKLPLSGTNGIVGKSDCLVCEACEFKDTFLDLTVNAAVILNIDKDHMEYFKTLDNLKKSFRTFAENAGTAVIYNGDDANTLDAVAGLNKPVMLSFGTSAGCDYRAENITMHGGAFPEYDLFFGNKKLGHVVLNVPGEHTVSDSLAAIACAIFCGASPEQCIQALLQFRGAGRRFEMLGTYRGITIADDYAHHPKELEVTLNAAKAMGYNRVWAVFQPFTFSRTYMLLEDFRSVLRIADRVVMSEIMGSREINTCGVTTQDIADGVPGSVWFKTFEEIADYIVENASDGDIVITLGCGDIYKAAKLMIKKLS
ncbi:MAG: UDP-N-acetylmuramate--L-alanine ligase [Clostridiales bacterium]|nr:UDP-N-acetylmuramate--L-alanine ligase [Clostridiales bacterium]